MAFAAPTAPGPRGRVPRLVARLTILEARRRLAGYLIATVGTAALTAALLPFRNDIAPLSKGFGYLVVVVAAAAIGGLGSGIVASFLGFLTFNFFFLPPYNSSARAWAWRSAKRSSPSWAARAGSRRRRVAERPSASLCSLHCR